MSTTSLFSKGQVIILKPLGALHNWQPGQKLQVIDAEDTILLKAAQPFALTTLAAVAGCLSYLGKAKTLDEMAEAIARPCGEQP